jgi:hypothetical protein
LPLELVYAGPPPTDDAQLCDHVANPPPPGEPCNLASAERVCPYAFWGLHRSIARTIRWKPDGTSTPPWTTTIAASSVLYGVTAIADEGSSQPLPSASVLATARSLFKPVKTARTWDTWLKRVEQIKPNLLVVLGHTEGTGTSLSIGTQSVLERKMIAPPYLRAEGSPRPLVLLIACATAALGDVFGSLPGTLTAKGAGAVVGTLSKIVGPQGAAAAMHLLHAVRDLSGKDASVGDAVAAARQSLLRERRPIGLVLVSHGEMDTKLVKQ